MIKKAAKENTNNYKIKKNNNSCVCSFSLIGGTPVCDDSVTKQLNEYVENTSGKMEYVD